VKGEFLVKDLQELESLASDLAAKILSSETVNLVLLLEAEMGAGKTTFTSHLGEALGIESRVTSPTFVGMHHYQSEQIDLYHYDCYQVKPGLADTLETLDFQKKKVLVLEWAENLDQSFIDSVKIKAEVLVLKIKVTEDEARQFEFS